MMLDINFSVAVVTGAIVVLTYSGMLRLRQSAADTRIYRIFKFGFPIAGVVLFAGLLGVAATIGRFGTVHIAGEAYDFGLLRQAGTVLTIIGLIGTMGTMLLIGVGIDIGQNIGENQP